MPLVRSSSAALHKTPNAVMRTLAAPSTGATELAVWEVSMTAGQAGPAHRVNREQVWVVLLGAPFGAPGSRDPASRRRGRGDPARR